MPCIVLCDRDDFFPSKDPEPYSNQEDCVTPPSDLLKEVVWTICSTLQYN